MTDDKVSVIPSPRFVKRLKKLKKSYPNVRQDVEKFIEQLLGGETPGDQIQGVGYAVYKVRIANRDAQRGKSGGYRVIYYLFVPTRVFLLTIYSKTEQTDISPEEIRKIIESLSEI